MKRFKIALIIKIIGENMTKVWFFIANPKTISDWDDMKDWPKYKGYYNWGIPNGSRNIIEMKKVEEKDIILCYRAYKKELIGWCKCTHPHYIDNDANFINRICVSEVENFGKPIKLSELKQMKLKFIEEYLQAPQGHSIVSVPKDDWVILKNTLAITNS